MANSMRWPWGRKTREETQRVEAEAEHRRLATLAERAVVVARFERLVEDLKEKRRGING